MEYHDEESEGWASTFYLPGGDYGVFDISLQTLKSVDTRNLFAAGRCIDGDRYGGASVRVMGTALATGQASGVAAALLASTGQAGARPVRRVLLAQGAIIDRRSLGGSVQTV